MPNTENTYVGTDLGNIALNPRGEYDNAAAYEYLDTVSYQGGSYMCLVELDKTVTGIAPESGKNTATWQMLTSPGSMTPEYLAAYDEVVNKAKQVETSRAAVELSQQEVEGARADVSQMRQDTQEAAEEAIASRDSAAGYAQSAEMSRTAAKESEDNINALVTGFDAHVAEKTSKAETTIEEARTSAVNAIKEQGKGSAQESKAAASLATSAASSAQEYATVANNSAITAQASASSASSSAAYAEKSAQSASNSASAAATSADSASSAASSAVSAKNSATEVLDNVKTEGTKQINAVNEVKKTIDTTASDVQKNKDSVDAAKTEIEKQKEEINTNAKKALTDISTAKNNAITEISEENNVQQIAKNAAAIKELQISDTNFESRMAIVEKQVANFNVENENIENILLDIESELASAKYPIGTQLTVNWDRIDSSGTKTSYKPDLNIVHYADTIIKDSEESEERTAKAMYLEWDKTIPDGIAFCMPQSLQLFDGTEGAPDGLPAGNYAIKMKAPNGGATFKSKWNGKYVNFTLAKAVPSGGIIRLTVQDWNGTSDTATALHVITNQGINESDAKIEEVVVTQPADAMTEGYTYLGEVWGEDVGYGKLNHPECCFYGDNAWITSDLRQWLNSEGQDWWTQQTRYNRKPNVAARIQGYLTGLDEELKKNIVLTKNQTIGNNQKYPNQKFVTYDKIFLHSFNQNNITTDFGSQYDNEGERWEYYKKLAEGVANLNNNNMFKVWNTYPVLIRYAINAPTSAQYVFSRSAHLSTAYNVHDVYASGYCSVTTAHSAHRCLPACAITSRNHAV